MLIPYVADGKITRSALDVIRKAAAAVFGAGEATLRPATDADEHILSFGLSTDRGVQTLGVANTITQMVRGEYYKFSPIDTYPNADLLVASAMRSWAGQFREFPDNWLFFDIETHDADLMWDMPVEEFFRLGQWAWGSGPIQTTTDYVEFMDQIFVADKLIGHNIHAFDLSVLFGKSSNSPLVYSLKDEVLDTMTLASITLPAPDTYFKRDGGMMIHGALPSGAMKWLGLDNLCFQLGLPGKEGDLKALAKEFGGFGLIPTDDPRFVAYAVQDIESLRYLTGALLESHTGSLEYAKREQKFAAILAQNSRNGFRLDIPKAQSRAAELEQSKLATMRDLHERYGFPTEGAMPWRTKVGKAAIMQILAESGVTPASRPDWPKTKTGNLSLGGEALKTITIDTPAEELGNTLATIMGQRTLAQQALDYVHSDGFVHPGMTSLQRSGRVSTTRPGLTVWTSRGDGKVEKSYFVPDSPDQRLVEFDFSAADARIVAAYSGDREFAKRFADGIDAHELTGRLVFTGAWVDEFDHSLGRVPNYDDDPDEYRQMSKKMGHAYAYRCGPKTLAAHSKLPLEITEHFVTTMQQAYPQVTAWQERVTWEGESGWVTNDWGRKMPVERGRAYTQAPALYGQSGTRELMVDALLRMAYTDLRLIGWLKAQVHDALVFSIPEQDLEWAVPKIQSLMSTTWRGIEFPVAHGDPGLTWLEANHD